VTTKRPGAKGGSGARLAASEGMSVTRDEIIKLENYLKRVFRLPEIQVRQRPRKEDSAEVYVGEEFIGILFRDDDEGEVAYQFQMAILDYDLGH
jgi:hypothetical protein